MAFRPDPEQLRAIRHVAGPMLVVAGAGTGKTTVLVQRIANLVRQHGVRVEEILAITYTRNAAAELRKRVAEAVPDLDCSGLQAFTFHAYCQRLLARHGVNSGLVEKQDLWIYLRQRIQQLPLNYYIHPRDLGQFLSSLCEFFDRCHDELREAADYQQYVRGLRADPGRQLPRVARSKDFATLSREDVLARCDELAAVFVKVEELLGADDLGTYGHQILRAWQLLNRDPQALSDARRGARFLLIDEFQDCNIAQIKLAQLLAGPGRNVFAVGDPDQAIFRFRGASSAAFDEFLSSDRFPDAELVLLRNNHRSTPAILQAAHRIIAGNPDIDRPELGRKPLQSYRAEEAKKNRTAFANPPVEVVLTAADDSPRSEAAEIVAAIAAERDRSGAAWNDFAVLYRLHRHRDALVAELAAAGIPFRVSGVDASEFGAVRDLLACLRAVWDLRDTESLFRVAALPVFGIAAEPVRDGLARSRGAKFISVLESVPGGSKVLAAVNQLGEQARAGMNVCVLLELVLARFGFDRDEEAVAAFREFVADWQQKAIVRQGDVEEFLQYMEFFAQAGGRIEMLSGAEFDDAVQLMTAHAAKGLEFPHTFILRANSNSFPGAFHEPLFEFPAELRDSVAAGDEKQVHQEEERRLFYVAMTRARDTLAICAKPGRGKKDPRPAGLLRDLMTTAEPRCWSQRAARPYTVDLQAAAAPTAMSGVAAWLLLPPRPMQSLALSASAVERYENCPLQFKLERDWNIPGPVAASMQFGSAIHLVLKGYFDAVLAGRPMSEPQALEMFRDALAKQPFDDEYQRQLYAARGAEQLRAFIARHAAEAAPPVIGTESPFEIKVAGVRVRGRIDRLDRISGNRVVVVDYKTGSPWTDKKADESLQLSIYAIAARERWQYEAERLVIYNVQDNTAVSTTRDAPQLADAAERVRTAAANIAAGNFDPAPGFHCDWCSYRDLCPATEANLVIAPAPRA